MQFHRKKAAALLAVLAMFVGSSGITQSTLLLGTSAETYQNGYFGLEGTAIVDTSNRILVDLNANDGRKASYKKSADNWCVPGGASASATFHDITFTLSNGGSSGGDIRSVNCKTLQKMSGVYPYLTMDGVTIDDIDRGGVIKLEISGLSAGTHSLRTWHSCVDNAVVGTMRVSINGTTTATSIACPTRVTDEDDAGCSYSTFEVDAGETVTVLIQPEGDGNAWLNGFELDGGNPIQGISRISPADQESHHDVANGLSWTAGKNAASHNVYLGTSYDSVFSADTNSPEFQGNQTGTSFALDESLSSILVYYWRVDTIDTSGNVIKGSVNSFQLNRLAFPTAEGYGRYARGGRGGQVIHVTNLNDSGEGSLRWALCDEQWQTEDWKGVPRIIVFDVGGVIELQSSLVIPDNAGNVYIAGQTAPGDGITLINYDFGAMGTSDLIIRDIRVRVGDMNGVSCGGMGLSSCNNAIIDHCSISWATDEGFSSRQAQNISFQWNIIGESLHDSVHYNADNRDETETHAFAASISGYTGSFHHNLLIDCTGRNWSLAGAMEQDAVTYGGQLDIRNNVVYNWMDRTTDGGVRRLNFVNNYYKAGPVSNENLHVVSIDGNELNTNDMQMMYVSGNKMVGRDGIVLLDSGDDAWAAGRAKSGEKNSTNADVRSDTPFFESYVNTESADEAYQSVITRAGAGGTSATGWDYIDSRYIQEVTNGTYTYTGSKQGLQGIIDSQNDAGGYPNASNFVHSTDGVCNAQNDTDRDGMPDVWETQHGLDPSDPTDGSICTLSADDYTNVEMYLNELAGDPVEYNAEPETELIPIQGELIQTLTPFDADYYPYWSIDTNLEEGDQVFADRTGDRLATYTDIPDVLLGAEYILTPCDAKNLTTNLATFQAGADMTVYVGLDSRVAVVPDWLSSWDATGRTIGNSKDVVFDLYALQVQVGDTITLGQNGQSNGCVGYVVFATTATELQGDVNADGSFNVADVVMLQQYLLGTDDIIDWSVGDVVQDSILNGFDLTQMRQLLLTEE